MHWAKKFGLITNPLRQNKIKNLKLEFMARSKIFGQ